MGAYVNPDAGFPGLGDAMEVAQDVDTGICQEPNGIPFGGAVFALKGTATQVWGPHYDTVTVTYSGAIASGTLTFQASFTTSGPGGVLAGGTTYTTAILSVNYTTSAANTMSLMVAAFNADANAILAGATMSSGSTTTLTIKLTPVSGGAVMSDINVISTTMTGQTVSSTVYGTQMIFVGIAAFEQRAMRTLGGTAPAGGFNPGIYYEQYASVNVVRKGRIWVVCANAVTEKNLAYIILGGTGKGLWTDNFSFGGQAYIPQSPQGVASQATPSGIMPIFRTVTTTINSQVLAKLDVRGIY
jgi:hypothetical protein